MRHFIFLLAITITVCFSFAAFSGEDIPPTARTAAQGDIKYIIENSRLFQISGDGRDEIQLPAPARAIHIHGDKMYVALGAQGVVVLILSENELPKIKRIIPTTRGRVVGFFEVNGGVWMQTESTTGSPVDESFAAVDKSTNTQGGDTKIEHVTVDEKATKGEDKSAIPQLLDREKPIRIENIFFGEVTLNVGARSGVKESDKFTVFREQVIEKRGHQKFTGKKQVGVLSVIAVNEDTSLAMLSRGDRVDMDDDVRPYEQKNKQYRVYPRRLDHLGEAAIVLRPLLNVNGDARGFGGLCDATVSWWGKYYFLNFRTQPVAFGWTENGNIVSSSILGEAGYDGKAFAVGIGAGVGVVNGDMDTMISDDDYWDDTSGTVIGTSGTRAAFALSQTVRLGARDGLNLIINNHFLYYNDKNAPNDDEDDSGFIYGGTNGRLNIPLSNNFDLFLSGGGGSMGYAFGEIGIFAWIVGRGDAGSWGLSAAAGGAGIWTKQQVDGFDTEQNSIAGPLVSLGITHRFGGGRY